MAQSDQTAKVKIETDVDVTPLIELIEIGRETLRQLGDRLGEAQRILIDYMNRQPVPGQEKEFTCGNPGGHCEYSHKFDEVCGAIPPGAEAYKAPLTTDPVGDVAVGRSK